MLSNYSSVCLFVTLWTVAGQAPLSVGFSRQEHWSGLPFPPPGDLPDPGIRPASLKSLALEGGFFTPSATWEASILSVTPRKIIALGKLDPSQAPGFQHQGGPAAIPGVPSSGACRASAPPPLSMVPKLSLLLNAARSPHFTCKAAANLFLLNLPPSCP